LRLIAVVITAATATATATATDEGRRSRSIVGALSQSRKAAPSGGDWPAPALVFHAAYGESQVEGVFEVWESRDAFEQFGSKLMPLLDEVGINAGQPEVKDVYKVNKP
jgi:hypothetical protein